MHWTCNSMSNLLSYWGLVDAKIRASDKDLPVTEVIEIFSMFGQWKKTLPRQFDSIASAISSWNGNKWLQDYLEKTTIVISWDYPAGTA